MLINVLRMLPTCSNARWRVARREAGAGRLCGCAGAAALAWRLWVGSWSSLVVPRTRISL